MKKKCFLFFLLLFISCKQEEKIVSPISTNNGLRAQAPDDFQDLKVEKKAGCNDKNTKEEIEKNLLEMQKNKKAVNLQGNKDTDCVVK